jgi:hypothetical protein
LTFGDTDLSDDCKDLLRRLLSRKVRAYPTWHVFLFFVSFCSPSLSSPYLQTERLGAGPGGLSEIQNHPFFKGIDWDNLRSATPPIIPGDIALDTAFPDVEKAATKTELFPAPRTFAGNQLPFVGYSFSRDAHFFVTCGLPGSGGIEASETAPAVTGDTPGTQTSSDTTLLVHTIEVGCCGAVVAERWHG